MIATESNDLEKGARVYWRGGAADSGTMTENSWAAITLPGTMVAMPRPYGHRC
jgi:hypothetical protein